MPVPALVSDPAPLLMVVLDEAEPTVSVFPGTKAAPAAGAETTEEPLVVMTSSLAAVPSAKAPLIVAEPAELSKTMPPGSVVKASVPPKVNAAPPVSLRLLTVALAPVLAVVEIE